MLVDHCKRMNTNIQITDHYNKKSLLAKISLESGEGHDIDASKKLSNQTSRKEGANVSTVLVSIDLE